jgi:hypothetical protein
MQMVSLSDQYSDSCVQLEWSSYATMEAVGGGMVVRGVVVRRKFENCESDWLGYAAVWVMAACESWPYAASQAIPHAQGQM